MTTANRWSDLSKRVASGTLLGGISVAAIWLGGIAWTVLLSSLAALAMWEWLGIVGGHGWRWKLAGLVYVGLAYAALLLIRNGPLGRGNVLFVMAVVWSGDIGAYVAGRLIGGPRLAPSWSPAKTWAGAGGGLAASLLAGVGVAAWFGDGSGLARAAGLALILGAMAQAGDMAESLLKRRFGRKDSGSLLPGHGGILDRVDGLLAAAPLAYAVSLATVYGGLWN